MYMYMYMYSNMRSCQLGLFVSVFKKMDNFHCYFLSQRTIFPSSPVHYPVYNGIKVG